LNRAVRTDGGVEAVGVGFRGRFHSREHAIAFVRLPGEVERAVVDAVVWYGISLPVLSRLATWSFRPDAGTALLALDGVTEPFARDSETGFTLGTGGADGRRIHYYLRRRDGAAFSG
jgi:hypothetical protein